MGLIEHSVVEEEVALLGLHQERLDLLPDQGRGECLPFEEPVDAVVVETSDMLGKVRAGVVDLARQQVLAVKLAGRFHDTVLPNYTK